jgi:mono/diheme cytochrome c family protein
MLIQPKKDTALSAFIGVLLVGAMCFSATGQGKRASTATGDVERGKYLVEEVAKCPECHTPRDARGNLDTHAWLQGAPIWIRPVQPIPNWADHVPPLAGLPSYTDEQMERVLEKGVGPQEEVLRPPMHTYHMNANDAKAIIAYLKSLPPRGQ